MWTMRTSAEAQARKQARTPPTAKKATVYSEAEQRQRRHRCITEVNKIFCRVLAGAQAKQLIQPDGELAGLDRNVEELIDVCIEHPRVCSEVT